MSPFVTHSEFGLSCLSLECDGATLKLHVVDYVDYGLCYDMIYYIIKRLKRAPRKGLVSRTRLTVRPKLTAATPNV